MRSAKSVEATKDYESVVSSEVEVSATSCQRKNIPQKAIPATWRFTPATPNMVKKRIGE